MLSGHLILFALVFSLFASPEAATKRKVVVPVVSGSAPLLSVDERRQVHGVISDFYRTMFANSKYELEFLPVSRARWLYIVRNRQVPLWLNYGSPFWDKEGLIGPPLLNWHHVLVSKKKPGILFEKIADLKGKTLALIEGFDYPYLEPFLVHENKGFIYPLRVRSNSAGLKALALERADAFVENEFRIRYHIRKLGHDPDDYDFLEYIEDVENHSIFIKTNADEGTAKDFVELANRAIRSGEIDRILAKYR